MIPLQLNLIKVQNIHPRSLICQCLSLLSGSSFSKLWTYNLSGLLSLQKLRSIGGNTCAGKSMQGDAGCGRRTLSLMNKIISWSANVQPSSEEGGSPHWSNNTCMRLQGLRWARKSIRLLPPQLINLPDILDVTLGALDSRVTYLCFNPVTSFMPRLTH